MVDPTVQKAEAVAKKAGLWVWNNWYAFGIGVLSGLFFALLLHWLKKI